MSGRLNRYLNQRATWGRSSATNEYGEIERTTSMIDCRIQKSIRQTQDASGRDITSTMTVYINPPSDVYGCEDMIGDSINGMPIIAIKEMKDAGGKIIGYEVML